MGFKNKDKSKKKKKKTKTKGKDGDRVSTAILPAAAMMAAVPRTPPPTLHQSLPADLRKAAAGGPLASSLVGKMLTTLPQDEQNTEETDTSLVDYENARQTMQSGSYYGTGTGSYDFSDSKLPRPPQGFGDDDDSETEIGRTPPQAGRRKVVEAEINPIYSTSLKSSQRYSRSPSPSTLRHSGTFTETGTLPRNSSLRSSGGSLGSLGTRSGSSPTRRSFTTPLGSGIEERIEAQMVERQQSAKSSLHSSLERSLTRVSTDLSATGSLRLNSLREQNISLQKKQAQLEQELDQQRQLLGRLQEQGMLATQSATGQDEQSTLGSLLQETCSMTDQTMEKQGEVVEALKERVAVLETEQTEMETINEQLRGELVSIHRMVSSREEDENSVQSSMVRKLKDERDTLQAMTIKLNAEMSRYQAKFRSLTQSELDCLPGLPLKGPKPSWLVNTKYLAPLFVAYDDQIQERDQMIEIHQNKIEGICEDVEEVIRENQQLHAQLDRTGGMADVRVNEWRTLQEQCKLVLEENQLLMEQLQVQQNKVKDIHTAHVQEISKLSKRLVIAEAERNQLEQELREVRDKMATIKHEHTQIVIENSSQLKHVELKEHVSGLSKVTQMLEEEKTKHAHELENATTQIQNLAGERQSLAVQVEELRADNQTIEIEMKSMQKAQNKAQKKVKRLQQALEQAEVKEQTAERYLSSVIKVAEKTAVERDNFVEKAEQQLQHKKLAMTQIMETSMLNNKMEEKLKLMRCKASEKLEKAASRMREQDQDFGQQRQEYEREIRHLRLLLRERDELLDSAAGDKKKVEDDLETMWQVSAGEQGKLRQMLQQSLRKFELHGNRESNRPVDQVLCDSDVEY